MSRNVSKMSSKCLQNVSRMSRKWLQNVLIETFPLQFTPISNSYRPPCICTSFFILDIWKGKRKSYDCSYEKKWRERERHFLYSFEIRLLLLGGMRKKNSIIGQAAVAAVVCTSKKILGFAKNSRVVFWHKNQNNHVLIALTLQFSKKEMSIQKWRVWEIGSIL